MSGSTTFSNTGSIVTYTVPATGIYDIVAYGAQGGPDTASSTGPVPGGQGAEIGGDVMLTAGQKLTVAVGGEEEPPASAAAGVAAAASWSCRAARPRPW